jgi:FSR family fosmidomycin resistance protein-like MFS transporter
MNDTTTSVTTAATPPARLALLSWAHFLNDGAANFLPGVLPAILAAMALPVSLSGTIMAALVVGQSIQPITGWLADRIGGKGYVVWGIAGTAIGGALIGVVPNYGALIAVLILIGVSNSCFHPQALASIRDLSRTRHGAIMSLYLVGGEIGRGLWPLLASFIVTAGGLAWLGVVALPGLLTVPFLWRFTAPLPRQRAGVQRIHWREHVRPFGVLVGFCTLRGVMIVGASTFIPILWQQRGGTLVAGASFITVMLVVGIVGNLGGGFVSDRLGRQPVILVSIGLASALFAGFLLTGGWSAWILLGAYGIALYATLPLTVLIGQDILPENPSLGSGIALGLGNGLGALGVIGLGPLAGAYGPETALWVVVACGAAAFCLAFLLPKRGIDGGH